MKFFSDTSLLVNDSIPMPGTILDPKTGKPEPIPPTIFRFERTFPNRLVRRHLRAKMLELVKQMCGTGNDNDSSYRPTMETVRDLISETINDEQNLQDLVAETRPLSRRYIVRPVARICTRKMMSRYWENFSPFALDLCGAIMRQGVFIEKMNKLDWLHSPAARETMDRLIGKYARFMTIMERHPLEVAVPTLDIDLAWHTHQLSPRDYYDYTVKKVGKFIDHDDKIDENKLGQSFEWTTKTYQTIFNEIYSECTCWYCEGRQSLCD